MGKALLSGFPALRVRCDGPRLLGVGKEGKKQIAVSQAASELVPRAQPPRPRVIRYRDSQSVRKGASVTLLLGSNQLLNHAQLLRAELWQDLGS